jgi:hypothetical protein
VLKKLDDNGAGELGQIAKTDDGQSDLRRRAGQETWP